MKIITLILIFLFPFLSFAATTTFIEPGTDATQDMSFWTSNLGVSGSAASATDQKNTGTSSIKMGSGASSSIPQINTPFAILADTGSQFSAWFRFDTMPPASQAVFIRIRNAATSIVYEVKINTNGTLANLPNGATSANGTAVLTANTWTRISISYYITNTTTYTFKVYVNGVLDSTTNAGTLTNTGTDRMNIFFSGTGFGASKFMWVDDVYFATGGASSASQPDPGAIRVTNKRPNASGTLNQWTTQIGVSGSGYGTGHAPQVNEQPLSTTNGWSIQNVATQTEEYSVEGAATGDVDVSNASIVDWGAWVYEKVASASTGNIIVGGTAGNISVTTAYAIFNKFKGSTTYPAGGTDVGVDTNAVNQLFSLGEAGVLVAYIPGASLIPRHRLIFFPNFRVILSGLHRFIFQ